MKVEVKICGLDREETVDAAVEAGAAMTGFVFYAPSPRNLTSLEASILTARIPEGVKRVGLFVNPTNEQLCKVLDQNTLDLIQLHGEETAERVYKIKNLTGLPAMKVLKISAIQHINCASKYKDVADFFLFDARAPKDMDEALPGGNALTFDWNILTNANISRPWILAGGLNPGNVVEAVRISGANSVDVSSGVEDRPGVKSVRKIHKFIRALLET